MPQRGSCVEQAVDIIGLVGAVEGARAEMDDARPPLTG